MSEVNPVNASAALFSKVQQRVLALLFGNPERSFYTTEILKRVNSGTGAVERELTRLHESGLISVKRIGNQKHHRANKDSAVYRELYGLILKTVGLAEPIAESLKSQAPNIRAAFVFGSMAKGTVTTGSDIDLMVIGDNLDIADLYSSLQRAELKLHRPLKPLFMSSKDWQKKFAENDSFVRKISTQPIIPIIRTDRELLGEPRA